MTSSSSLQQENTDLDALNDAVGVAGVDLTAEEERMKSGQPSLYSGMYGAGADRRRRQGFVEQAMLEKTMTSIASVYKLKNIEPDVLSLVALAAQERLRGLVDEMVKARDHRIRSDETRAPPVYPQNDADRQRKAEVEEEEGGGGGGGGRMTEGEEGIWEQELVSDAETVLRTLYRSEKEEEMRARRARTARESLEREEAEQEEAAQAEALKRSAGGGGKEEKKEKKRKKEGRGAMSEDQAKKFTDATAKAMTGGRKYAWMTASGGATATTQTAATDRENKSQGQETGSSSARTSALVQSGGGNLEQWGHEGEVRKLSMRDVEYAYARERGGGNAGRGSGSRAMYVRR